MADIVSRQDRSRMMAGIRGKNTKPEILIRRGLHRLGFRFRLHDQMLPGKPDLVLAKHRAVILVNGCFWHAHGCPLFKYPSTSRSFWKQKLERNRDLDARNVARLRADGWRVLVIWECSIKGRNRLGDENVLSKASTWLYSNRQSGEIRGRMRQRRSSIRQKK